MEIDDIIARLRATPGCEVFPPSGMPIINNWHVMPNDLRRFYEQCGGLSLFKERDYSLLIVPPSRCVLANPVIVGEVAEEDISSSWYIIADDGSEDYLTIDLSQERLGRCYDSFHEVHGVAGSSPVIALSFTDLLVNLYKNAGAYWYWLRQDFISLGDAYDNP